MKSNSATVLDNLAKQINIAHKQARQAAKASLERAIEAGEYLIKAKECVGHGDWLAWLADNVTFSDRSAQAYMRCARHKDEINTKSATVADLTLREGIETIAMPRLRDPILAFHCPDMPGPRVYKTQFLIVDDEGNELRPARVSHLVRNGEQTIFEHFQRPLSHDLLRRALDIEIHSVWDDRDGQPFVEWRDLTPEHMAEIVAAIGVAPADAAAA